MQNEIDIDAINIKNQQTDYFIHYTTLSMRLYISLTDEFE